MSKLRAKGTLYLLLLRAHALEKFLSSARKLDSFAVRFRIACQLTAAPRANITAAETYEHEPSEQTYFWNTHSSPNFYSPHGSTRWCDRRHVNRASQNLCCRHPDRGQFDSVLVKPVSRHVEPGRSGLR